MTRLFAILLALYLAAGTLAIAGVSADASMDCTAAVSASAGGDEDCCAGKGNMSACFLACAICPAAATASAWSSVAPDLADAPLGRDTSHPGLVARPPDTAPPKSLFA